MVGGIYQRSGRSMAAKWWLAVSREWRQGLAMLWAYRSAVERRQVLSSGSPRYTRSTTGYSG